ncbi:MAG TPA: IS1595 family transposase [Ktedonobacteraceae bacterium]|nr:IS1595 family transposase [Ktedonobacteraceae bacterium]
MSTMNTTELNLSTIAKHFSSEEAAYELIESIRWPAGPICPHCGSVDHAYFLTPENGYRTTSTGKVSYRRVWKCADCRQQFSVLVGTIFEDSKIPLSKWLLAIHLLCQGKNGVSAHELHRTLKITYKSAWFMAHRIRYAMERQPLAGMLATDDQLTGIVEADETYIGGKARGKRGRGAANKTPVVTLVERNGEARSQVMEHVTGKNIKQTLEVQVSKDALLMTDELNVYTEAGKSFASHETVEHGKGEYVRGKAHINTAEGYFSQLKRSIDGTHHHVSAHHLHRYLGEFDYRYNTRKITDSERTQQAIQQTTGKRLMYQQPIQQNDTNS